MLYPDRARVPASEAWKFFLDEVLPHMPEAVSMGNDDEDGSNEWCQVIDITRLSANIRTLVMRSL